ncbi:MAG TPA: hypothetical protein VMB80_17880 [Candidatus Acidoferrum sp.]|nr:hypothetical protein [Candidatus Acidoferrum sp.]
MITKKIGLFALLASIAAGELPAGTITNYAVGDVLVCFRNGSIDLVVDAGPISTLTNFVSANHSIPIGQYSGSQVNDVGIDGASWSAFTWSSDDTLFVTRPRTSVNVQTTPWPAKSDPAQYGTVQRLQLVPVGAQEQFTKAVFPDSTSTAVLEEDNSQGNPNYQNPGSASYHWAIAGPYGGNFNGTFAGNPEMTTPGNFSSSGQVARSDFYMMIPTYGTANGKWLGYFELSPSGTMTYVAYPTTTPVVKSITRSGTTTTINYKTGLYGTYTLRGTNRVVSGLAATNWPAITTLSSGDTATHVITDTTSDDQKFYIITAQ